MKDVALYLLSFAMVAVGVAHFARPEPFVKIVPAWLPNAKMLVYVSGVFEIAGGLGLLWGVTRAWAAWGLVALYVAVFPANVNQAVKRISFDERKPISPVALWVRLPFQVVFVAWAVWVAR